jgi:hypothetical protein
MLPSSPSAGGWGGSDATERRSGIRNTVPTTKNSWIYGCTCAFQRSGYSVGPLPVISSSAAIISANSRKDPVCLTSQSRRPAKVCPLMLQHPVIAPSCEQPVPPGVRQRYIYWIFVDIPIPVRVMSAKTDNCTRGPRYGLIPITIVSDHIRIHCREYRGSLRFGVTFNTSIGIANGAGFRVAGIGEFSVSPGRPFCFGLSHIANAVKLCLVIPFNPL